MTSKRRISSLRLTRRFHLRYFGLWVLLCVALILMTDVALLEFLRSQKQDEPFWTRLYPKDYILMQRAFVAALVCVSLLLSAAVTVLAVISAHRIAGPFIRLKATFDAVKAGETLVRLRFRRYDRLDSLAADFNAMMDSESVQFRS